MKSVKKLVHYCDYCGKRSLSKGHLRRHEDHCTANPNRICGVCECADNSLIEKFKARFTLTDNISADGPEKDVHWAGEPVTLAEILEATDNCPACTLAILRQCGFNRHYFRFEAWDFKKALAAYMADKEPYEAPDYYSI